MAMRSAIGTIGSDRDRLCAALAVRGKGSILRGFRRELDTDGSMCIGFLGFCKAAKRLGVMVDASRLFAEVGKSKPQKKDSPDVLTLEDLAPAVGKLVSRFQRWMVSTFGGPGEMFLAFEAQEESHRKLSRDIFVAGCRGNSFEASDDELNELFSLLDVDDNGCLAMEDAMFLDVDQKRRQGAILKATNRGRLEQENLLAVVFREDCAKDLPGKHRLAPREWHIASLGRLPALIHEKHKDWQRCQQQRAAKAMAAFMTHLNTFYGNPVRAWRRGLDPQRRYSMSRVLLGRYCMRNNVQVDVGTLWKALDQDSDGLVSMEELGPRPAMALARVREWLRERYSSCADAWEELRAAAGPSDRWKSDKKMLNAAFIQALEQLGCPVVADPIQGGLLCGSLDFYACGFVSREDLEWLDRWPASSWLSAVPDAEAWAELRRLMFEMHGRPLRVWRSLLDKDNSNLVTWAEFQEACQAVRFRGNIAGAWCYLDQDVSGTISLQEFDPHTAEMLASFKAWVQDHFGTVEFAFRSLDTDGTGSISFSELKRGCLRLKWEGDAREIFECLDDDSSAHRKTISYKDLQFLDSWEPNPWTWEEAEHVNTQTSKRMRVGRTSADVGAISRTSKTSLPKLLMEDSLSTELSEGTLRRSSTSSLTPTAREERQPRVPKIAEQGQGRCTPQASPYATKLVWESREARPQRTFMPSVSASSFFSEGHGGKVKRQLTPCAGDGLLSRTFGGFPAVARRAQLKQREAPGDQHQAALAATVSGTPFEVISGRTVALAVAPA